MNLFSQKLFLRFLRFCEFIFGPFYRRYNRRNFVFFKCKSVSANISRLFWLFFLHILVSTLTFFSCKIYILSYIFALPSLFMFMLNCVYERARKNMFVMCSVLQLSGIMCCFLRGAFMQTVFIYFRTIVLWVMRLSCHPKDTQALFT